MVWKLTDHGREVGVPELEGLSDLRKCSMFASGQIIPHKSVGSEISQASLILLPIKHLRYIYF